MSYNFNDELKKAEEAYGFGGGDTTGWFKITEGDNRIRIASEPTIIAEHFKQGVCYGLENGCKVRDDKGNHPNPSVKWLTHVVDRKDGQVKLAKLPYSIMKDVGALQGDPDWAFEAMPMPYDINIKAKGAGTKEVEYTVIGSPKRSDITSDELIALDKQKTPSEIVDAMKEKQMKKDGTADITTVVKESLNSHVADYPEGPSGEDIPF